MPRKAVLSAASTSATGRPGVDSREGPSGGGVDPPSVCTHGGGGGSVMGTVNCSTSLPRPLPAALTACRLTW